MLGLLTAISIGFNADPRAFGGENVPGRGGCWRWNFSWARGGESLSMLKDGQYLRHGLPGR